MAKFERGKNQPKKVMVFGTFDGIHEGHRHFLRQAKACGDYLIVVMAQDSAVRMLKNRSPRFPLAERMAAVQREGIADEVVVGDAIQYSWGVIRTHRPAVIALGYDQAALRETLEYEQDHFPFPFKIRMMAPYQPDRYHSSFLPDRTPP